jgi:hypothetical protein
MRAPRRQCEMFGAEAKIQLTIGQTPRTRHDWLAPNTLARILQLLTAGATFDVA